MGLQLAVKAHTEGNLILAESHYRRAYEQGVRKPVLYQNLGALLRQLDRIDEALDWYEKGIQRYPDNLDILINYANIIRATKPATAIQTYLRVLRQHILLSNAEKKISNTLINLLSFMFEQGLVNWNLELMAECANFTKSNAGIFLNILLLIDQFCSNDSCVSDDQLHLIHDKIEESMSNMPMQDQMDIQFSLFQHYLKNNQHRKALNQFDLANKTVELVRKNFDPTKDDLSKLNRSIDINFWNGACTLLKLQDFDRGWKMFDYGLRAPCDGPQRWQRSLVKPFDSSKLQPWQGQNLNGRSILLLDEQGIGDAMMFLSLVPSISAEASVVGLFLSDRLLPVYRESFAKEINSGNMKLYSRKDFYEGKLMASDFDFQSPIGSICQYRFFQPEDFAPRLPVLTANAVTSKKLREKYIAAGPHVDRIIGISWRGGGKAGRIKQKSIDIDSFRSLIINHPNVRFVSLQYGESKKIVNAWKESGVDVIHDDNIDPMKDIYNWLSQVSACDAVVSVANTTIHGAGGLNIPTQCLLSSHADWRWIDSPEVTRSYWYPSVAIARESQSYGWTTAFSQVRDWISTGTPYPKGPVSQVLDYAKLP